MSVRTAPLPDARKDKKPGHCTLCGTAELPGRRRSWCSDRCVDRFLAAKGDLRGHGIALVMGYNPDGTRVFYPDSWPKGYRQMGHCCADCSGWFRFRDMEVDHVKPLWSLTEQERLSLDWWTEPNLQLLCIPCHRAKTKQEAGLRARLNAAAELERTGQTSLDVH